MGVDDVEGVLADVPYYVVVLAHPDTSSLNDSAILKSSLAHVPKKRHEVAKDSSTHVMLSPIVMFQTYLKSSIRPVCALQLKTVNPLKF